MSDDVWLEIPFDAWRETKDTLHMYTQVVGKLRLALSPPEPQWAHVTLYVTARGLTTGPMRSDRRIFQVDFDFVDHVLSIATSDGGLRRIPLVPRTVADFYGLVMEDLHSVGVDAKITTLPTEVPDPIPFPDDTVHAAYDAASINRFWRVLAQVDAVLREYRAPFLGRSTPVHFFWGTFDLACARYSGRPAEPPADAGLIHRRSADAEQACVGFWPGNDGFPEPAFFAYTYPKPDGLERASVRPDAAFWSDEIGEFLLRYDDARQASSPSDEMLAFFRSTYDAGATLAGWDRARLERPRPDQVER